LVVSEMVLKKVGSQVEDVVHHCYRQSIISVTVLPHKLQTFTSHNKDEELIRQTHFSQHELVHIYLASKYQVHHLSWIS